MVLCRIDLHTRRLQYRLVYKVIAKALNCDFCFLPRTTPFVYEHVQHAVTLVLYGMFTMVIDMGYYQAFWSLKKYHTHDLAPLTS